MENDEKIEREVIGKLQQENGIDFTRVNVQVVKGDVKLTGFVSDEQSIQSIINDVWSVKGVVSVSNELEIQKKKNINKNDAEKIKRNIINSIETAYNGFSKKIGISVKDGLVILEGFVDSLLQKSQIEVFTFETKGVERIKSKLSIVPTENSIDKSIAACIIDDIELDKHIDINLIHVKVKNGTVDISGVVHDDIAYKKVGEIVESTPNVKTFTNNIIVP